MASISPSLPPPPRSLENTAPKTTSYDISDLLSELSRLISDREAVKPNDGDENGGDDDENKAFQYDPAVLQQLEAVSSEMQVMSNYLRMTIWQMDNVFDGVHTRMNRLSSKLDTIESGLKVLMSRSEDAQTARDSQEAKAAEKAAEEHNQRARLLNQRAKSQDKLVPLHNRQNRPIANFTADTPYKLANEHNRRSLNVQCLGRCHADDILAEDKIVAWLKAFGLSTEKKNCQIRLIDFIGVPYDRILDNVEIFPISYSKE